MASVFEDFWVGLHTPYGVAEVQAPTDQAAPDRPVPALEESQKFQPSLIDHLPGVVVPSVLWPGVREPLEAPAKDDFAKVSHSVAKRGASIGGSSCGGEASPGAVSHVGGGAVGGDRQFRMDGVPPRHGRL
ncbi:unnamed protein product [Prorocentrum cordatum]|uniref:Uncharacterized protein n=1 Tax=Prorocentrum cordatum TaxID=2364126 RepID=A0ABN9UPM8_9DINO|nr:unnamed protein product [Polarella glacialis]